MTAMTLIEAVYGQPSGLYAKPGQSGEHVVSAAVKVGDDIYLGDDHDEAKLNIRKAKGIPRELYPLHKYLDAEEGFYTSHGRFLSRHGALELAQRSRQINRVDAWNQDNGLDSGDLYANYDNLAKHE